MLRKLVLGLAVGGLAASAAVGQFASDRVATPGQKAPAAPPPFGGLTPTGAPAPAAPPGGVRPAGGYVPPVGGFTPASASTPAPAPFLVAPAPTTTAPTEPLDIPLALGKDHPLALRPEHGKYLILVRSYSRPARPTPSDPGLTAKELAEGLAAEIRKLPQAKGLGVYLFEHISEERKAEAQAAAEARRRAAAYAASMSDLKKKAELNGMTFLDPDQKLRYKTFNYRDQIGVMVGGFETEQEAVKALARVKAWPTPADVRLLDGGSIARQGPDGKATIEKAFLNPYGQAMVVTNPSLPKPQMVEVTPRLDPFVVKLNDGRPYSLLKATKGWTLGVKAFTAPVKVVTRDDEGVGIKNLFGGPKAGEALAAGAEQAEQMAKALREMKDRDGKSLGLEAYVLHHRTGSMVTVGQFDSPTDPTLNATRRMLMSMNFQAGDPRAADSARRFFEETILPIPIPKP